MSLTMRLSKLCAPAKLYLVLSAISIVAVLLQNLSAENLFCIGIYECSATVMAIVVALKLLYVVFWTWLLNLICKEGYSMVSWVLVLFPIVLFAFLLAVAIFYR